MSHDIIIKHDSGEMSQFTLLTPENATRGSQDYVYAEGRSCTVYLAENSDGHIYVIKKFKEGFQPEKLLRDSKISQQINEIHKDVQRAYILHPEYMGCDEKGNRYQVFKFYAQPALKELVPLSNVRTASRDALCEGIRSLLVAFRGLLSHVGLIHCKAKYLHCDITLSNVIIFRPNDQPNIQLIDWDSVLEETQLLEWSPEQIRDYMLTRSSPKTSIPGLECDAYTEEDINKYSKLDFKKDSSLAYVLDTTALAKILCILLFGNTTFLPNSLTQTYQGAFLQSFLLLEEFFATAFSETLENRFTSCARMIEKIDEVIKGLPRWINYNVAHAELLEKHSGLRAVEDRLEEINFDILPHIQFGETVYVQQGARSPLEQLMELTHRKALFLYGEGGAGKSTTAKHFFYSTLRDRPEDRLVLYYPLTQKGIRDIGRYLESPLSAQLLAEEKVANKPIVLLDALDESAIVTSNAPRAYHAFYELVQEYSDRYCFIVTSRNIPKTPKEKDNSHDAQKDVAFSDVFLAGRFLALDDDQLQGYLSSQLRDVFRKKGKHEMTLKDIEQTSGKELIETLRLPMMLKLFVQIVKNASAEEKEKALQIRNEVELIHLYFQKLFKEDKNSLYYDREYQKGEEYYDLYANEGYSSERFEQECVAIAEATFFRKPHKLTYPERTLRIFNSIVMPTNETVLETRCREFASKLYNEKFKSYTQAARQKYLEDIHGADFTFGERAQQIIFEKVLVHLRDLVTETSAAVQEKKSEDKKAEKEEGISRTVKSFILIDGGVHYNAIQSNEIKSFLRASIESFDMPTYDSANVFDPFDFSHKCFRDYFRSLALARQFEALFRDLEGDHRVDKNRIRENFDSRHNHGWCSAPHIYPYAYFDSKDYRKIADFFQTITPHLSASKNEWKFTGLRLSLSNNEYARAKKRADQFRYLYVCYFGHFPLHAKRFGVMNDLYHMICLTYKYFGMDPFEPSVKTPEAMYWPPFGLEEGETSEETWFSKKPFTVSEAHGSRYASVYRVPDGVERIEFFDYCPDINKVILGKNVNYIAPHAFDSCPQLKEIDVSQNKYFIDKNGVIFQIDSGAPVWPGILPEEITFPENIPDIDFEWEYKANSSWATLSKPNSFYNFQREHISGPSSANIQKMVFFEGVQKIQSNIFGACPNLIHVVLPKTLKSLPKSLYYGDIANVKYLTISKNFFDLLPKTLHYSYEESSLVFAPSVTTIYYMGTSREWRAVEKPESFFTNYFPKLREVICYSDGVTLTRRGKTTMMSSSRLDPRNSIPLPKKTE